MQEILSFEKQLLTEYEYMEAYENYIEGQDFVAGMGAEAIKEL